MAHVLLDCLQGRAAWITCCEYIEWLARVPIRCVRMSGPRAGDLQSRLHGGDKSPGESCASGEVRPPPFVELIGAHHEYLSFLGYLRRLFIELSALSFTLCPEDLFGVSRCLSPVQAPIAPCHSPVPLFQTGTAHVSTDTQRIGSLRRASAMLADKRLTLRMSSGDPRCVL